MRNSSAALTLLAGTAFSSLLLAGVAGAQTTPPDTAPVASSPATAPTVADTDANAPASEIVVTGSRIARPDLAAASPVAVINPATFRANNTVTVEQLLTSNPQFVASGTSASNNPGDGAATIDLRGLGANRTLVLIDGKRVPAYEYDGVG